MKERIMKKAAEVNGGMTVLSRQSHKQTGSVRIFAAFSSPPKDSVKTLMWARPSRQVQPVRLSRLRVSSHLR